MTFSFAPGDDQQRLVQTTVPPAQPSTSRRCPVPTPGCIAHMPEVSPSQGCPHARVVPVCVPIPAISHRKGMSEQPHRVGTHTAGADLSEEDTPIHPSSPISLCTCPVWLLSLSDTDVASITASPGASKTFRAQARQCYWCHLLLLRYKAIHGENCMCVWHSSRWRLPLVVCLAPRLDKQVHEQLCSHLPRGWYQQESQYAVKILFRLY